MKLGYRTVGDESAKCSVIVLHDWFCDTTSFEPMLDYLELRDICYYFVDLRGYGRSKEYDGEYTLEEAAGDVLDTIDALEIQDFHIVGYSMTSLVAQLLCASQVARVQSGLHICPVSACGLPATDVDSYKFMLDAADADDDKAQAAAHMMTSNRHTEQFACFKQQRWRECSVAVARMNYCRMFVESDITDQVNACPVPTRVILGKHDAENHRIDVLKPIFDECFCNVDYVVCEDAGHYPMQETPVTLADRLNRWFGAFQQLT